MGRTAVEHAFCHPLSLIQGPPGTGKTEVAATLVYHFVSQKRGGVLVCAASNAAADHLAEKILLTQVSVVRLYARAHNPSSSHSPSLLLESHLGALASDPNSSASEYVRLRKLRAEFAELSPLDSKHFDQLRRTAEAEVLSKADVVVCTCSTAAESRIVSRVDSRLRHIGRQLERSACAGASKPLPSLGPDGVPASVPCCAGQLKSFYGADGYRGETHAELCAVLEVDRQHITSKTRLNNALPPAIAALLTGQLAAHRLFLQHGVPFISEDEALVDVRLRQWRNGLFASLMLGSLPPLPEGSEVRVESAVSGSE
ncbi:hypothetical protein AB1Y20_016885 [Prymnesium parvum]|uniref:DNA2/NAM7 helicase helicase domain-containing protein n=1 Tax=Prymnesium parvum TaxID=97485 RepID=A0AB34I9U2_PRYPA